MVLQETIFHFDIVDNKRGGVGWVSLISACLSVAVGPLSTLSRTGKARSHASSFMTPFHSLINWLHLLQLTLLNGLNMISFQCSDSLYSSVVTAEKNQFAWLHRFCSSAELTFSTLLPSIFAHSVGQIVSLKFSRGCKKCNSQLFFFSNLVLHFYFSFLIVFPASWPAAINTIHCIYCTFTPPHTPSWWRECMKCISQTSRNKKIL